MAQVKKYIAKRIKLLDRFLDLVIQGRKTSTIRYGLVFVTDNYIPLVSSKRTVVVRITKIDYSKNYGDLDEKDAKEDGFNSLSELKSQLERFYPNISADDPITIISFVKDWRR